MSPLGDPGTDPELLALLVRLSGISDLGEVRTFKGFRKHPSGATFEVTIEILDRGPASGPIRWSVTAVDEEGRLATGNPDPDLGVALIGTHWFDLDRDEAD